MKKLRKIAVLAILLFAQYGLNAQCLDKLSIELNLGRYAKPTGLFEFGYYSNALTYLNGFDIGYSQSDKLKYYLGFRKINSVTHSGGGYTFETSNVNGVEFRFGANLSYKKEKRFFVNFGLELFGEFETLEGSYVVDYPGHYVIDHQKTYFGFAPSLELNLRIVDCLLLFTEARYRMGIVNLTAVGDAPQYGMLFPNRKYWANLFEPINAIGVRFEL